MKPDAYWDWQAKTTTPTSVTFYVSNEPRTDDDPPTSEWVKVLILSFDKSKLLTIPDFKGSAIPMDAIDEFNSDELSKREISPEAFAHAVIALMESINKQINMQVVIDLQLESSEWDLL